jgi:uncharacterized protein (TIGR02679 family)
VPRERAERLIKNCVCSHLFDPGFLAERENEYQQPAGHPDYLSLRTLLRSPPCWDVAGLEIYVCENPNLIAIAADQLGRNCAPMMCTDGMPSAAQRALLTQLNKGGAQLMYHGDFDWSGLQIANEVMGAYGASPWTSVSIGGSGSLDTAATPKSTPNIGRS